MSDQARKDWNAKVGSNATFTSLEVTQILGDWDDEIKSLEESYEADAKDDKDRIEELKDQVAELQQPKWGNCVRGCPPSYLDVAGFCSPACKLGAPRGEFVTMKVA